MEDRVSLFQDAFSQKRLLPSLLARAVIEAADFGLFEKDELITMLAHLGESLLRQNKGVPVAGKNERNGRDA
jgi:predicted XRE-type DNA-binding protein